MTILPRSKFAAILILSLGAAVIRLLPQGSLTSRDDLSNLQGSWSLIFATMDGKETVDPELANSTWTFRGDELILEMAGKRKVRFRIRMETGAKPKAFYVTPVEPGKERSGWMIFSREQDRLKIAFYDNLKGGRPESFEPGGKLLVLTFSPKAGEARTSTEPSPGERNPCELLRAAGIAALLGDTAEVELGSRVPGSSCGLQGVTGEVVLVLTGPPMGKVLFEAKRASSRRDARIKYSDEPDLGVPAFSRTYENGTRVEILALKDNLAVALQFGGRVDSTQLRQFAKRLLAVCQ